MEISLVQSSINAPVSRGRRKHQVLTHKPEELGQGSHSRRTAFLLDPGDRGLGRAGADRQALLAEPVLDPGFPQQSSWFQAHSLFAIIAYTRCEAIS